MFFKSSFRYRTTVRPSHPPVMEAMESRELLSTDVLMYHNNLAQTGANTTETILNRSNVNSSSFGKKLSIAVQGQVYAQPLYVSNLRFGDRSVHNVVYVVTEHDQVYAFDADSGATLWHFSVIKKGQTPVPSDDTNSDDVNPEIGITSTPVIDRAHNAIYFVAKLKILAGSQYVTRLYCLNITTGAYKFHQPINIQVSSPGSGDGSNNGTIDFQPLIEAQRPGLTLYNGVVYVAFASHGDMGPYHGWLLGYSATTLQLTSNWNATPDGGLGGIWESGGAPSVDSAGNLYVATGNGTFDADSGGSDYGDSVVRIPTSGGSFTPSDSFTPFDEADLEANDIDFGSTGVLILPDQGGAHPHELLVGGKSGKLYLVDRDNMGGISNGFDNVVQTIQPNGRGGGFDTPAYYGGRIYYAANGSALEGFTIKNGVLAHIRKTSSDVFSYPGANPIVSASGSRNGIVWVITKNNGHAVLEAFNSADLTQVLYTSDDSSARDQADGDYVKFSSATVADGHAFIGTDGHLDIYGLL